jgi:hypothetical protein
MFAPQDYPIRPGRHGLGRCGVSPLSRCDPFTDVRTWVPSLTENLNGSLKILDLGNYADSDRLHAVLDELHKQYGFTTHPWRCSWR